MSRAADSESSLTLGMGKRSWASWDSPTRGMEMRLGRTTYVQMMSWMMVSHKPLEERSRVGSTERPF